ncbi:MAG: hypothetical protein JXR83_12955 [Deltaproteobacteria bacterium]|nr:hypothetical protein [Deltaproteobacteria bacterium]
MSIKRTKQRSFSRRPGGDDAEFGFMQSAGPERSWEEQIKEQAETAFVPYSLVNRYAKGAFILHQKFGKGVVVSVEGAHVVVLFAEGKKSLGHGKSPQPPPPRPRPVDPDAMTEPGEVDADPAAALVDEVLATTQETAAASPPAAEPTAGGDLPGEGEPR